MSSQPRLTIVPMSRDRAVAFIVAGHRHHRPPQGYIFALGVVDEEGKLRGVATIGRPVARQLQNGFTAEVTRVCTDGCANACSALYGAAWRVAKAMGYVRLITYTLPAEGGASLRGSGWLNEGPAGGGSWSRKPRPREDNAPIVEKTRWSVYAGEPPRDCRGTLAP